MSAEHLTALEAWFEDNPAEPRRTAQSIAARVCTAYSLGVSIEIAIIDEVETALANLRGNATKTCKRPGCDEKISGFALDVVEGEDWPSYGGYCSRYCRDIHAVEQDAQALYRALREWVKPENLHLQIPELNHTYTETL